MLDLLVASQCLRRWTSSSIGPVLTRERGYVCALTTFVRLGERKVNAGGTSAGHRGFEAAAE